MSMSTTTRILSATAAAAVALTGLAGCSLITTLAEGADPVTTETPVTTDPGGGGEGVESPPPTTSSPPPTEAGYSTSLFDLKVGDCFDLPQEAQNATLFSTCDVPHTYEAFGVVTLTDPSYPGDDAVSDKGWDGCRNLFSGYVGSNPSVSTYDIYMITPSEGSWNDMNDREVLCLVYLRDGSQAVGSAANSRR